MNLARLADVVVRPSQLFADIARDAPAARRVLFGYAAWLGLVPPVCAYLGVARFGWRLGVGEPVRIGADVAVFVALAYYAGLLAMFFLAALLARWMAPTYGATAHLGRHAALVAVVGTPLMLGGLLHLYPLLPLNILALVPALIWSAYLLYAGVPVALGVDARRGMLMASSMLGVFFAAALGFAALTMILWAHGVGPDLGFNRRWGG